MHATDDVVCLEQYRDQRRRGRPHGALSYAGALEERVMEGLAIAFARIEADVPEFQDLRACLAGAHDALLDVGAGIGEIMKAGGVIPVELMVAQSQLAGLKRSLQDLVTRDLAENRAHRAIVTALRGEGFEGA